MVVKDERGQAIFEMMVFLPLFIFMLTIIFNVGDAINISINQQKVTRRYFYYLAKGNSYLPTQSQLEATRDSGTVDLVGFAFNGYRQRSISESPIGPCFKFNSFLTGGTGETCEDPIGSERTTNFIKVFTGYGLCGETFMRIPTNHWVPQHSAGGVTDPRSQLDACTIR